MSVEWIDAGYSLAAGRYRLIARVGSGGMAVVWRALDTLLDREVAIKLLIPQPHADSQLGDRLLAEARAVAQLHHRHVTAVYDFGQDVADDGTTSPYVVMELIDGPTLRELIEHGEAMSWHRAAVVAAQVASALAYAHSRGIVHRDISCANIAVTDEGVKVLDFGLAALLGQPDSHEGEEVLGTPAYIAPERLRSREAPVAPASDVYGLGIVWYQMMTGQMPWAARTSTGLIQAHMVYAPAPLPPIGGLPDRLRELCMACLAKSPADRPSSHRLDDELAPFLREPAAAGAVTQPIAAGRGGRRRVKVLVAVAGAVVGGARVAPSGWGYPPGGPPHANAAPTRTASAPAAELTAPPPGPTTLAARPAPNLAPSAPQATEAAEPSPEPTPEPPGATEPGVLVTATGGTVRIVCADGKAQIVNVATAPGYTMKDLRPGPGPDVQVVLKSPTHESRVKATCSGDVVVPVVEEKPK